MTSENNVVSLVPWSISVRRAAQRRKAFDLLDEKDAGKKIRALGELETYYAIKEIGLEDAVPILGLVGREQTRALIDIEVWHRQVFDPSDLLIWLSAYREAGIEIVSLAARAIDIELMAMLFKRRLFIALRPKDDVSDQDPIPEWLADPPDEILPLVETNDRRFIIAARTVDEIDETPVEEEDRKWILRLVDDLYKDESWEEVAGMLRLGLTDMSTTLEEDALRFRNARLEDLGFPPMARAIGIYGPLDPDRLDGPAPIHPTTPDIAVPVKYAEALNDGLFARALGQIVDHARVRAIEGELVPVANRALVADHAEPGQIDEVTQTLTRMRGYIEIALAYNTEGDDRLDVAVDRLQRVPLTELFRIGYTVTLRLAARAKALRATFGDTHLEDEDRALFDALSRRRPGVSHLGIERTFWAPEDVLWVDIRLTELETTYLACRTLGLFDYAIDDDVIPPPAERSLESLVATAVGGSILGRAFRPEPLSAEQLADLADRVGATGGPDFSPADRQKALAVIGGLDDDARRLMSDVIDLAVTRLADALWPLVGQDRVDPRFVGVVLRRPVDG